MSSAPPPTLKWQFASRFRRGAFGWRSDLPIKRITEALSEIKAAHKGSPIQAAIGSIILLEKISGALENVDSSSGALGGTVNHAISLLVPYIASTEVESAVRRKWLDRLWQAFTEDAIPYIERLGDYWGELCASPDLAARWADELIPFLLDSYNAKKLGGYSYFKGTSACLSCLLAANRHEELLVLLDNAGIALWNDRLWGVKALLALGKPSEALRFAEKSRGKYTSQSHIAQCCEDILLSCGESEKAYAKYAIDANQSTTHLATFRAISKKYPSKSAEVILRDLIRSTPTVEGKWFAAAKSAGQYELALEVVRKSATDPRTLIRAARDFAVKKPSFAASCALAALHWIAHGFGYEMTRLEISEALDVLFLCARSPEVDAQQIRTELEAVVQLPTASARLILEILKGKASTGWSLT
jgi:type IV secretory pathway TrbD component